MLLFLLSDGNSCPENFLLNPSQTDKHSFLQQFKPCGYYTAHCQHKFEDWFGLANIPNIEPNVCYPGGYNGRPGQHMADGVHLVQFDIGLDEETYKGYQHLKEEYGDRLIHDVDTTRKYLDISNSDGKTGNDIWTSQERPMKLGESCVETFVLTNDDWGRIDGKPAINPFSAYNCMGSCGPSSWAVCAAKDCRKHDGGRYFKSLALKEKASGFCMDFDCGDEAAQTVTNCWIRQPWPFLDTNVICDEDVDENNPNFYSQLNWPARVHSQKRECTLRTGWDRNQGIPSLRNEDGTVCTSNDDCQSRRCDRVLYRRWCKPRLELGERCNEDTDCVSLNCRGRFSKKCS